MTVYHLIFRPFKGLFRLVLIFPGRCPVLKYFTTLGCTFPTVRPQNAEGKAENKKSVFSFSPLHGAVLLMQIVLFPGLLIQIITAGLSVFVRHFSLTKGYDKN